MSNTPGKAQEIVGVKVIQTVSCTQAGAPARGPRGTMALPTILVTGPGILIACGFHDTNPGMPFDKNEGVVKRQFFSAMLCSTAWISERWRTEALKLSR